MSSAGEFLAKNAGTTAAASDLAALERRFSEGARIAALEKRIAELERKTARSQELVAEFLAVLAIPAVATVFSPQSWIVWFAWLYVIAVGYELTKRLFRFLMS